MKTELLQLLHSFGSNWFLEHFISIREMRECVDTWTEEIEEKYQAMWEMITDAIDTI